MTSVSVRDLVVGNFGRRVTVARTGSISTSITGSSGPARLFRCGKSRCSIALPGCSTSPRADLHQGSQRHMGGTEGPRHRDGVPVLSLYPQMTVEKNLSFGLKVAKDPAGRDRQARDACRGDPADPAAAQAQTSELSGGQRQRVAIGRALVATSTSSCSTSHCLTSTPAALRTTRGDQAPASVAEEHDDLCHP
ncbi:ATP-binding cassette domain-containing protein [Sinorhizobium meliloti]|nr:ATP-binding cassette domain-containing protein [Sinorhizobium meliloti]